jgi:iron complex transport system ATP-binding protein
MSGTLEARRVTLGYGRQAIVEGLDLTVLEGQITALVGANGCGKSTLLRGLARLLQPQGGGVYLDGRAIATLPTKEVARAIGILPQGPVAPEGMTVRELVAQGRYPHQSFARQWSSQDEDALRWALDVTHMEPHAHQPLDTLSGGQRQRAWIAMTLAQETPTLLLDEPTTFLDMAHQAEILTLLDRLNEEQGRTIVMVLHDVNQASRYAHWLIAMKDGRIVADGAPADIVDAALISEVFGLRCTVVRDPVSGTPMSIPQSCPMRYLRPATPPPTVSVDLTTAGAGQD